MYNRSYGKAILFCGLALAVLVAGCAKKAAAPPPALPPTPTPAPARPTVTLQASSTFIQKGESVTLSWSSTNATELTLDPGIGRVAITVSAPAVPPQTRPSETMEEMFLKNVHDAFFDLDKSDLRADARDALAKTAEFLRSYPQIKVTIEGHCDERGSTEYNLGLGERRAQATRQFLISLGVAAERMETVSYGKEKPFCITHDEDCWQKNRRAHFVMAK